jgi:hypothetical protein
MQKVSLSIFFFFFPLVLIFDSGSHGHALSLHRVQVITPHPIIICYRLSMYRSFEIMFHVSTLLPYYPSDPQRVVFFFLCIGNSVLLRNLRSWSGNAIWAMTLS